MIKKQDLVTKYSNKQVNDNFVPIDEKDVERALNVPVKEKITETIEKSGKKEKIKRKNKKKTEGDNWTDKFKIPGNKNLKVEGPILIITEKPQAALKIANALAEGKIESKSINKVPYYNISRNNQEIQIVSAVGHLFTVAQVNKRNSWPTLDISWAPNYLVRKNDFTKKYYDTIAKLCKTASSIIVATDYDIEGEVIGMNIVKYICNQKDAGRMKFSTLTANEIQKAYEKRANTLDWKQGIAGETRHYLDWLYGINLSRALMKAVTVAGSFRLMSIGRVQGPALNIIVQREKEIESFVPEKYWQIFLEVDDGKNKIQVKHIKDIFNEKELEKFKELKGKKGIATMQKNQRIIPPPTPFDLTSLQIEIYKLHSITPSKTLQIAQKLYLAGIISYPRTSSQKIPKEIGYDEILKRLEKKFKEVKFISRKTPNEGKKSDPAHPSIYPTGEFHKINEDEEKVYNLIVKRFISCFCDNAIIDSKRVEIIADKKKFSANGNSINKKAWMEVYPSGTEEKELVDMEGEVDILNIKIEDKMTKGPGRYSPASIISTLEKKNLGTKATRASILETLYDRGYVKDKNITATSLGIALIKTLENNCPIIIEEELTRNIEKELESIRNSKEPLKKEQEILRNTENSLKKIGEFFDKNMKKIGEDLIDATKKLWEQQRKENELGICPNCKKGKLGIRYAKQYKRYFVACDAYPDCKTTYTLPPDGMIKKTGKNCEECGFPLLMTLRKGKKPWIFCFNPECPTRKKE